MATEVTQDETQRVLEEKFLRLAARWKSECAVVSSTTQLVRHPAYQAIIALGEPVVPLLLRELARDPDHWFTALKALTGQDPVPPESRGRIPEMTHVWLEWGKKQPRLR